MRLRAAGLDSLPGAGAEILVDRVRKLISAGKCTADQWLDVMRTAHRLKIPTSATMMFGHVETIAERFIHLEKIRALQAEKPADSLGFTAFILWPFQDEGTKLKRVRGVRNQVTPTEYVRMLALSRLMLPNIPNIQVSWLTVGPRSGPSMPPRRRQRHGVYHDRGERRLGSGGTVSLFCVGDPTGHSRGGL